MKLFTASQIKEIDSRTIEEENISSYQLMQRAGKNLADALLKHISSFDFSFGSIYVFCGHGNNGGDGIEIANHLSAYFDVKVFAVKNDTYSNDFQEAAKNSKLVIHYLSITEIKELYIDESILIIDALLGTGLNREVSGMYAELISKINENNSYTISIDVPSGISVDAEFLPTKYNCIKAHATFTIEFTKLCFYFPETAYFIGNIFIISIELSETAIEEVSSNTYLLHEHNIESIIKPRMSFGHKGTFGHACIYAGSRGKVGAAILSLKAALRSGCGLVSGVVPQCAEIPIHSNLPEAMLVLDASNEKLTQLNTKLENYSAIGIGPGIGIDKETENVLKVIIQNHSSPIVIDADGINILSENKTWFHFLKEQTILTPHPKEFDRLTDIHNNTLERYRSQLSFSKKYGVYVVLKGHHTMITTPSGQTFINTTGNSGMATAGSGDVLTGIITGLLAQGYSCLHAACIGVYMHGKAGDEAAKHKSEFSLIASDIIEFLK